MAIQKQKLPKPSEVKKSPTSFTKEELQELKDLRLSLDTITFQLGRVLVERIKLEETKLTSKYGKGSIDIETGTFIPS